MDNLILYQKIFYNLDLLFEDELNNVFNDIDKLDIIKDVKILLSSSYRSIINAKKLLASNSFIDSMVVLRSGYEAMLKAMGICVDEKIRSTYMLLTQVKFVDGYNANKNKGKNEPSYIRIAVSKNYKYLFSYEYEDSRECETHLKDIYNVLSKYTHPTVLRLFYEKIELDKTNIANLKKLMLNNIYEVCSIFLDFFFTKLVLRDKNEAMQSLYGFLFICNMGTIVDLKNFKKVISKHNKYLYIKKNDKYIKEAKQSIKNIPNLKEMKMDKKLVEIEFSKIVRTLDCEKRLLNLLDVPKDYQFISN